MEPYAPRKTAERSMSFVEAHVILVWYDKLDTSNIKKSIQQTYHIHSRYIKQSLFNYSISYILRGMADLRSLFNCKPCSVQRLPQCHQTATYIINMINNPVEKKNLKKRE